MIRYRSQTLTTLIDSINRAIFALQDVERNAEHSENSQNFAGVVFGDGQIQRLKDWRTVANLELAEVLAFEEQERTSPIDKRPFVTWRISLEGQGIVALVFLEKLQQEFDTDSRLTTVTRNHEANALEVTTKERFVHDRIQYCIKQVPNHYPTTSIKVEKLSE